jgi:hypothetical protein
MPLLDHFHPPLHPHHHWKSFHSNWATRIADALNEKWLPREFLAEETTHAGARVEVDVATFERTADDAGPPHSEARGPEASAAAAVQTAIWSPPVPAATIPGLFPDTFEVQVFSTVAGMKLVGAIELISPGNKDRHEQRQAFAIKCAAHLQQGVSVVLVDIVTNRRANLHNELLQLIGASEEFDLPEEVNLYSAAYRPVSRGDEPQIDLWTASFDLGQALPVMPLRLTGDLFVPVDLDSTYQEACRRRRLV